MSMLKGALHLHSTYSDGEFHLRELREIFSSAGCAFACVTDHAEAFDANKLGAYVRECESLSDESFRIIPGLEYECRGRTHILGYGVTSLADTRAPEELIRHIDGNGGVSVIAHPEDADFPWIETLRVLPTGIECWNSKYDGQYAPRPATFRLLWRLQERKPATYAFYGQDLHWKSQFCRMYTIMPETSSRVLTALASGNYVGCKGDLTLPSSGRLPAPLLAHFARVHRRSHHMRQALDGLKRVTDYFGLTVPSPLKAQLRRIF